jgi:hypothetical protein
MKRKTISILILIVGIILILIYGINWTKRFFQIDSCLDKGGRWNYELNECENYYDFDSETITKLYWYSEFDTVKNYEILIKGELLDSIGQTPYELIEILNRRKSLSKIELIDFSKDTIRIRVLNDEYLTEQMGSAGAYGYLGETVFTLTENNLIEFVRIEMNYGSHASPGIYSRIDFKNLMKN